MEIIPGSTPDVLKTTRTPRSYESIEKGALALELKERVDLRNKLDDSISHELNSLELKLKAAKEIVNGK